VAPDEILLRQGEAPPEPELNAEPGLERAIKSLGAAGLEEMRKLEVDQISTMWEQLQMRMESAKDNNAEALAQLSDWREAHSTFKMKFLEDREQMQSALRVRFEKRQLLKSLVDDAEKVDALVLKGALHEANEANVATWDKELIENAGQKAAFLEAVPALQALVEKLAVEPLGADPGPREELTNMMNAVEDPMKRLQKAKIALPEDLPFQKFLYQAENLLNAPLPTEEGDGAEDAAAAEPRPPSADEQKPPAKPSSASKTKKK
jgi:hypothetical protein